MSSQVLNKPLIPASLIPSAEVLEANPMDKPLDLFHTGRAIDLGEVPGNFPDTSLGLSFLRPLWNDIYSENIEGYKSQMRDGRTEDNRKVVLASHLQLHLVACVDESLRDMIRDGETEETASARIKRDIDRADREMVEFYEFALDSMVSELAKTENGQEQADPDSILTRLSIAPSNEAFLAKRIREVRLRQQRLKFEWLSANAIIQLLSIERAASTLKPISATRHQQAPQ